MNIQLHHGDLPDGLDLGASIAIDTETMGLNPHRDRLCLVQLSAGDGNCHLVRIPPSRNTVADTPNLKRLLADPGVIKLFHFGRFDIAALKHAFGVTARPVYCTKTASRLVRTFTDRHGLKDLCKELLGIELKKEQQSSDWGAPELSQEQLRYAASDAPPWPGPALISCRHGPNWIWPDGPKSIFSLIDGPRRSSVTLTVRRLDAYFI
jgi:ribonuclease D